MLVHDPNAGAAHQAFRELLEEDPKGTRQQFGQVSGALRERGLNYADDALPLCFAPALVSAARLSTLEKDFRRIMRLLLEAGPKLLDPYWLDLLAIPKDEQELILLPQPLKPGRGISRLDGFVQDSDGDFKMVELNIDSPGGGAFMDISAEVLLATPLWREFRARYPGRYLATKGAARRHILDCWADTGGTALPRIAIVDWITVNTVAEFELLKEEFISHGLQALIADPRELEFRDGKLRCYDGIPIDMVYRRVLVEDLLREKEAARPFLEACRAGAVVVVNPFSIKPLTVKTLLSLIHQEIAEKLFATEDLKFLRRFVPWTGRLEPQILETLARRRHELVLKPADGWGAEGLFLGWTMSQEAWESALEEADPEKYVIQERVQIPEITFPVATDSGWDYRPFKADFDPYMFGEELSDPLVRLASSDVLNVKAGAQIAVTWVLDP